MSSSDEEEVPPDQSIVSGEPTQELIEQLESASLGVFKFSVDSSLFDAEGDHWLAKGARSRLIAAPRQTTEAHVDLIAESFKSRPVSRCVLQLLDVHCSVLIVDYGNKTATTFPSRQSCPMTTSGCHSQTLPTSPPEKPKNSSRTPTRASRFYRTIRPS